MRPPAVAVALVGLLLVGCSGTVAAPTATGTGGPSSASSASVPTSRSAPPTTTGTGTASASGTTTAAPSDPDVLTMAFAGDIHFEDYLGPLATRPDGLAELQSSLGTADLAVANLETALTTRGTPIGKEFHFRTPASALATVAGAGIDAVSMANNHGVDFGPLGLRDTLAAKRRSPVPIVGIGADEDEAFAPAVLEAKGLEVAVFGASQVYEMTLLRYSAGPGKGGIASSAPTTRIAAAVRAAARKYDLVVVFLHWGLDYQKCPDAQSAQTAAALERAGADVVVGGHSHRVNGSGWMGRSYVHYGLGNFVWWRSREPDARSGVLTLSIDVDAARGSKRSARSAVRRAVWTPMLIGTDGIPRVPTQTTDRARLLTVWKQASACSGLAASPS